MSTEDSNKPEGGSRDATTRAIVTYWLMALVSSEVLLAAAIFFAKSGDRESIGLIKDLFLWVYGPINALTLMATKFYFWKQNR